jgi:hypothetical protein
MKYLKRFEAVIMPNKIESNHVIRTFEDLVEYGRINDFDVVEYDEFYNSLSEKNKKEAPPRHAPFFALFHPIRKRAMFVVSNRNIVGMFPGFKGIVDDIIGHERVHAEQARRKGDIEYKLPSPNDRKAYFSDKDEIMAFSWTIANGLSKVNGDMKSAIDSLNTPYFRRAGTPPEEHKMLWNDIKIYCDEETIKRYKKYIYLYLEKIFNKKEENIHTKINRK